eukprot:6185753-Pleurochrysis_carterae.AAC.1
MESRRGAVALSRRAPPLPKSSQACPRRDQGARSATPGAHTARSARSLRRLSALSTCSEPATGPPFDIFHLPPLMLYARLAPALPQRPLFLQKGRVDAYDCVETKKRM